MRMKEVISVLLFFIISNSYLFSQIFTRPTIALKSHETLDIIKVESSAQKTVIYLSIENRITSGNFCADKNIYIIYPDGSRSLLTSSDGIPVCPDSYRFKTIGEKLDFILTFPPLKQDTQWIDLIEDCTENCFSFYGVTLDNDLNKEIDDAFVLAENDEPAKALVSFIKIAEATDNRNLGIKGLLYASIIKLAKETGYSAKAAEWYKKLKSSNAPRLDMYIKNLKSQGIAY
jgi:hypothetical protein